MERAAPRAQLRMFRLQEEFPRSCGLSPRVPGTLGMHTSVGGWWRHTAPPRPPRRQGHSEPQWVDPTPAGAPQDPGTHTSVGGWQRRPAHTVRTGAAAPAQGPAVVARVANGTRSQASRSFSLHPHLRQRFRPYQVTAAANFRTCAPGRQAAPSPGTSRPAFCRPQPLLSLLQGDGALKARQFSRWNKAHTQSLHSCR